MFSVPLVLSTGPRQRTLPRPGQRADRRPGGLDGIHLLRGPCAAEKRLFAPFELKSSPDGRACPQLDTVYRAPTATVG